MCRKVLEALSLLILQALCCEYAVAQTYPDPGLEWREKELWRAKRQFNQGDLSPVHEAFSRRDPWMLWTYFLGAGYEQFGVGSGGVDLTPLNSAMSAESKASVADMNKKIQDLAGRLLAQMPGHAKVFGDRIEKLSIEKDRYWEREMCFVGLGKLGSEESIQQLGRFLFDKRNPDKDSKKYYATPPANDRYATMWLQTALGKRSPLGGGDLYADGGMKYGSDDKLRQWWLKNAEAAPYRQGLLASGVALPPNYPALPETAKRPDGVTARDRSAESASDARGWGIGLALLALVATSVWLAVRRQAQKSR